MLIFVYVEVCFCFSEALKSSITQPIIIPTPITIGKAIVSHIGASHAHSAVTTPIHITKAAILPIHFFIIRLP